MKRERWPSNTMFVFAAVGSAVGLGNIWRFPYLVGKYGGGAFLIPFLIVLFVMGFPLMVLEFSLGQKMQQGIVGALKKVDRRLSGIGIGALLSSFGVSSYYAVIMGWALLYVFYSLNIGWTADTEQFFLHDVLQASSGPSIIGGFAWPVVRGLVATWVMVYFCIWKGVKGVSRIIKITMPLPIILLVLLLARTSTLPGAFEGLKFYLKPDFNLIWDPEVWMAAIGQVFFTLSLGFGVMISYASYQPAKSDIIKNALIACLADVAIAFVAGLVIFSTIGYMAHTDGEAIVDLAASGPSLAFIVLPRALALIPGAALFSVIFFVTLISLGIDSLFSMVEAIATLFYDLFPQADKKLTAFYICLACIITGLVFTTSAGIYYIDIVDHYITIYGLVLVGLMESIAIGWLYDTDSLRRFTNKASDFKIGSAWNFEVKYLIPICLFLILCRSFYNDIVEPYGNYPAWAQASFGWGLIGFMIACSVAFSYFQKVKES